MADLIYDEVELFGVCLLLGIILAFVYDGFRIFRMLVPHKNAVVDLEDLLFWLFTAWLVFRTLFTYNRGALRGYAFLGMVLGVLVYTATVSRLLLFLAGKMVPYWKKAGTLLCKPFSFLWQSLRKILKNIVTEVKIAIKGR